MQYITCKLMGGLGNQLFQIFATIAYGMNHNCEVVFEYTTDIRSGIKRYTFWDSFLSSLQKYTTKNSNHSLVQPYLNNFPVYNEPHFHYIEVPYQDNIEYLSLKGYFQSYKYFVSYWDEIQTLISLDTKQQKTREKYCDVLNNYYNISMHFRVGDYKDKPNFHPIMKEDYYNKCIDRITTYTDKTNIQVIYFYEEDDEDCVRPIISSLEMKFPDITFTGVDHAISDWEQLLLMSCCHSNIIANSTFSWWAAYMNNEKDKMVCYPTNWFGESLSTHNTADLFPNEWIEI